MALVHTYTDKDRRPTVWEELTPDIKRVPVALLDAAGNPVTSMGGTEYAEGADLDPLTPITVTGPVVMGRVWDTLVAAPISVTNDGDQIVHLHTAEIELIDGEANLIHAPVNKDDFSFYGTPTVPYGLNASGTWDRMRQYVEDVAAATARGMMLMGRIATNNFAKPIRVDSQGDVIVGIHSGSLGTADGLNATQEVPVNAADSPFYTPVFPWVFNGTTWDRLRGSASLGLTVNTELPAASPLAGSMANPTTPLIGSCNMVYSTGTGTWSRWRSGSAAVDAGTGRVTLGTDDPLVTSVGAQGDAVVAAGATGSVQAKLRRLTTDLDSLKTLVDVLDDWDEQDRAKVNAARVVDQMIYTGATSPTAPQYQLKQAILDVATDPDEIIAAPGASKAIYIVGMFCSNIGDEAVIFNLEDDVPANLTCSIQLNPGGGGYTPVHKLAATNDAVNVDITTGTATHLALMLTYIIVDV